MKLGILLFPFFLIGCKESTSKKDANVECSLQGKVENDIFIPKDFTSRDLIIESKDKEGTPWKRKSNDMMRFVFSINGSDLLVYKNGSLFKKYSGVTFEGKKSTEVDRQKCEYDTFSSKSYIVWKDGEGFLEIYKGFNYSYFNYWFDTKTKYTGNFDINY